MVTAATKLKDTPWEKSYDKPRQHIKKQRQKKKQRQYFANKCLFSQSYSFSSSHVWMWELDHKKGWAPKNWCFWIVVLEKILESPLDCKEIQPVNPKGNQSWIFIGRTDAEAEASVLWPLDAKSWCIRKDPDAGKDWRPEDKGTTEDNRWLDGMIDSMEMSLRKLPGNGEGQGSLARCSPWGRKESDMTEQPNNSYLHIKLI